MYLIAIGWLYVALMMAVVEAFSSQGSLIGGFFTFLGYGLLPVGLVMYALSTGDRKRARQRAEAEAEAEAGAAPGNATLAPNIEPDASGHTAAAAQAPGVAPMGKEP